MKFKVGDKVKIIKVDKEEDKIFLNKTYTIVKIYKSWEYPYSLDNTKYDENCSRLWKEDELELVKPKNMKVIDLLVKISKGEEVPNKFKFASQTFTKRGNYIEDEDGDSLFDSMCTDFSNINSKIEIIEESQILDETEKKYLKKFIGKYLKNCSNIKIAKYSTFEDYYINFKFENNNITNSYNRETLQLPCFTDKTYYKGMELNKEYTLEELGLK